MMHDPIVEEVRAAANELVAAAGGDLHRLCEMLREREQQHPARNVTLLPQMRRAVSSADAAAPQAKRAG